MKWIYRSSGALLTPVSTILVRPKNLTLKIGTMESHSSTSSTSSMSTLPCVVAASVVTVLVGTTLRLAPSFVIVPVGSIRRQIVSSFITRLLLFFLGFQVSNTFHTLSHIILRNSWGVIFSYNFFI